MDRTYEPSASSYSASHVSRYEATGGVDGAEMSGAPIVILHTIGRKTGHIRKSPLIRVRDGERYVVIASMGGAPAHPAWYLNLVDDPEVTIQDGDVVVKGHARTADGDERDRLWQAATAAWPDYNEYQTKTDRQIPVVVIEPS